MIADARSLDQGFALDFDVCVVGAGAAGLTLASELEGSSLSVGLLESGGFEPDSETQDLYRGAYAGDVPIIDADYLHQSRLRFFGGTTNHWGGVCRPLDRSDFEARDWVPDSGWPISRTDLDPFYRRASLLLEIGAFDAENPDAEVAALPPSLDDDVFVGSVYRFRPKRFGPDLREAVTRSRNVRLVHHANALEIETDETGARVVALRIATLSGRRGTVRARVFVLAAGAIENARLLLVSDGRSPNGVGNAHDLVGRYFMEHLSVAVGVGPMAVWPEIALALYRPHGDPDRRAQYLGLADAIVRERRLLNTVLMLPRIRLRGLDAFERALVQAGRDVDRLGESDPGLRRPTVADTVYVCEQAPNRESRVVLSDARDALGLRRVRLEWKLGGGEIASIRETALLLARSLGASGRGRARLPADADVLLEGASQGFHHIGTTRMHADARRGVVDASCRVHGVENLFVSGSSVFPTSGVAHPTFTILALAVRLADAVKQRLGVG